MKMYQREIAAIFETTFRLIKDQLKKYWPPGNHLPKQGYKYVKPFNSKRVETTNQVVILSGWWFQPHWNYLLEINLQFLSAEKKQ